MAQTRIAKAKRQYTVLVGCGRLGAGLASGIADEDKNVMIIDRCKDALRKLSPAYGGLALVGDATDIDVLKEAQLEKATEVIVVTDDDNTNIMIAQMACFLFATNRVIVRLYDPQRGDICRACGIEVICPATLSAEEIRKRLLPGGGETQDEQTRADSRRIS